MASVAQVDRNGNFHMEFGGARNPHRAFEALPRLHAVHASQLQAFLYNLGCQFRIRGEGEVLLIRFRLGSWTILSIMTSFSLAFSPCRSIVAAKICSTPFLPVRLQRWLNSLAGIAATPHHSLYPSIAYAA
jgi:hypothetical protein